MCASVVVLMLRLRTAQHEPLRVVRPFSLLGGGHERTGASAVYVPYAQYCSAEQASCPAEQQVLRIAWRFYGMACRNPSFVPTVHR